MWYDFETGLEIKGTGTYRNIEAPLDHIPVHIRGGNIVPKQEPGMTTAQSRLNPFHLIAATDGFLNAFGELYLDDGISLDSISSQKFTLIHYNLSPGNLKSTIKMKGFDVSHLNLKEIVVYGAQNACEVKLNGQNFVGFEFDSLNTILKLKNVSVKMSEEFEITWMCTKK
jgi:alpha-glucosidase (family GH31 glycosyl hydrolase)